MNIQDVFDLLLPYMNIRSALRACAASGPIAASMGMIKRGHVDKQVTDAFVGLMGGRGRICPIPEKHRSGASAVLRYARTRHCRECGRTTRSTMIGRAYRVCLSCSRTRGNFSEMTCLQHVMRSNLKRKDWRYLPRHISRAFENMLSTGKETRKSKSGASLLFCSDVQESLPGIIA